MAGVLLTGLILGSPFFPDVADAKRKPAPIVQPDLRIVSLSASPDPYTPGTGVVDFTAEIELPDEFPEGTLLEVSSLISSPSMVSMRFLSVRRPLSLQSFNASPASRHSSLSKRRVSVTLTWDGMDQSKEPATGGRYHYEVHAKLLTVGENGPRTQMTAWPKRGTLVVK